MVTVFRRRATRCLAVIGAGLLAACAQTPPPASSGPPVADMLAGAAKRAADAQEVLAMSQRSRTLPSGVRASDVPPELAALRSVDWVGPIEAVAQNLAREAGYDFTRVGAPPAADILVDVQGKDRPIIEMLHSVGLQAKGRADLVVNPGTRTVKVVYAPL